MQDLDRIEDLLKGDHATAFNLVYLQDEVYKFKVHEDGREWSVYGSPVWLDILIFRRQFSNDSLLPQWSPEFCGWAFNYKREDGEGLILFFFLFFLL